MGYLRMSAGAYRALDFIRALLEHSKYYSLLSPVELIKKLTGLAKMQARVISGIGLIYCKLFIRIGLSSQGRVPVPAVVLPALNDFPKMYFLYCVCLKKPIQ